MNSDDVNKVIDKLADKLGVAVEQVEPLAEQVVSQYVLRSTFWGIGSLIIAISFLVVGVVMCHRTLKDNPHETEVAAAWAIIMSVIALIPLALAFQNLGNAIAPLPSMLGL